MLTMNYNVFQHTSVQFSILTGYRISINNDNICSFSVYIDVMVPLMVSEVSNLSDSNKKFPDFVLY